MKPVASLKTVEKLMRYLRALSFIICILAFFTSCSAGRSPSYHGVQGSYEASSDVPASALKPLIILDAGHGGTDEGAKVNTFMEKKLTLTTSLLIKKHLEELGYRVIMTRSRDAYLPLQRRVSIANKTKGSLFVSVHFNSSPSTEAQGVEIFYFDSKEMWRARASKRLANCILHRIVDQTEAVSRGVKQGNFHVIRETDMPAVLVEGGFITNRDERAKLRDRAYLDRLAVGVAQGIDKYMKM
ncbi:MAG: N-acetylmuramoyl-L-alanine amidase [Verrucomicrobia bacterium]|nr:N-acetylmuramoyl-L-alanine amidase [Verrucomicrobiota bacterium]